jgi:hypothetical protein
VKGIKGQLSSLSITDLIQWIEMNKKSGVLFVSHEASSKCFCFKGGKLLLASSKDEGKKFGDVMSHEGDISPADVLKAVSESRKGGGSFISCLIEDKQVPVEFITEILKILAERNIIDILSWPDGFFEFFEDLPSILSDSPVELAAGFIVFESVRKHDELLKNRGV